VVARDPNWNTNAGAQAFTALIAEKPAAIVIHNPDVQTYAKLIKKAEDEGIAWCRSTCARPSPPPSSSAPTGWTSARRTTGAVVEACKGKSNKIAIVQERAHRGGQRLP
jgi:simple sugar transport system substrate-binding protein/ribose transport system substrate-binding protein